MKKILIYTSIAFFLFSCSKFKSPIEFSLDYNFQATIPKNSVINTPIDIMIPSVSTNSSSIFQANNTVDDLITSITLESYKLELLSPIGKTLSFLKSIEILISATGLPEIKLAYKDVIPANQGTTIDLDVSSEDLRGYIKSPKFAVRLKFVTDEAITTDVIVDFKKKLKVKATLL